jgi:hypothetical protein
MVLGIIGGMVGGWLFELAGEIRVTGFNLWSMFVAVIGGCGRSRRLSPHAPSHPTNLKGRIAALKATKTSSRPVSL